MPIEIRELIIKTEIRTKDGDERSAVQYEELRTFKKQLLEECRRLLQRQSKRNYHER